MPLRILLIHAVQGEKNKKMHVPDIQLAKGGRVVVESARAGNTSPRRMVS